jgi:hypothetical protein
MKRFTISAVAGLSLAAAAHADTTVTTPRAPVSKEAAAEYVTKLDLAVKRECQRLASPVIGTNVYVYQACLASTRADVEKKDPTGLYASRDSDVATVLAAR